MSERKSAETHDEVLRWVEQLRDDIQRGDWNTAYEESLPIVTEAVENRTSVSNND